MLLAICVVLALFMLLRPNPLIVNDICESEECVSANRYMEDLVDTGVDPCQDFYGHVCNKWIVEKRNTKSRDVDFVESLVQELLLSVDDQMHLLRTSNVDEGRADPRSFVRFYQSCYDFMNPLDVPLRPIIPESLKTYSDIARESNFTALLVRLMELSLTRGIETVFGADLVRSGINVHLDLSRGRTLTETLNGQNRAADEDTAMYLRDIFMAAFKTFTAVNIAEANVTLERLLDLNHNLSSRPTPSSTRNVYTISSLVKLIKHADTDSWLSSINRFLPRNVSLSADSVVVADDLASITEEWRLFEDLDVYKKLYIYLNIILSVLSFDFKRRYRLNSPVCAPQICLEASQKIFMHGWASHFISVAGNSSRKDVASSIFHQILKLFANQNRLAWIDRPDRNKTMNALGGISLHLYERMHDDLPSDGARLLNNTNFSDDFISLFLYLKRVRRMNLNDLPYDNEILSNQLLLRGKVVFSNTLNSVVVPLAMERAPLTYAEKVPLQYTMGTLGALIAKELTRALFVSLELKKVWKKIREFFSCIQTLPSSVQNVTVGQETDDVSLELFLSFHSARLAYEGLRDSVLKHQDAKNWVEYWRNVQRTFFIRFCLLACSTNPVAARARCVLPLVNMEEFSSTFNCSNISKMHVYKRCEVW